VLLVRHAGTAATRRGDFAGDDDALDPLPRSVPAPDGVTAWLAGQAAEALASPARRARETATLLDLAPATEARLRPLDVGAWTGRGVADVAAEDPAGLAAWRVDPDARPHGGETLTELAQRCRALLAGWAAGRPGPPAVVAVTHGAVVRALVAAALDLPPERAWRLEAGPGRAAALAWRGDAWAVTALDAPLPALGRPAGSGAGAG